MKYFIDTEFIEGFHKPLFGKRRHYIDLISIGIVCEDGRSYYAISKEFNPKDASQWVKDNVISKLPEKHVDFYDSPRMREEALLWKFNATIAKEIREFIFVNQINFKKGDVLWDNPEFYAYYADYDWVVFCSLFGTMMDLPMGFPMYCKDLKQMVDEKVDGLKWLYGRDCWSNKNRSIKNIGHGHAQKKDRPASFEEKLKTLKELDEYPKQQNEHSALDDAKWNFELYKFLTA